MTEITNSAFDDPLNLGSLDVDTDTDSLLDDLINSPLSIGKKHIDLPLPLYDNDNDNNGDFDYRSLPVVVRECQPQPQPQSPVQQEEQEQERQQQDPSRGRLPHITLMNAVQMEVQENAKVPNLYHVPVRRTNPFDMNAFGQYKQLQQQQQQQQQQQNKVIANIATAMTDNDVLVDEILRLTEEDLTLTENFLGNGQRMSAAAAYSNAGALMSSIGTKVANITDTENKSRGIGTSTSTTSNTIATNNAAGNITTTTTNNTTTNTTATSATNNNAATSPTGAKKEQELNQLHHSYSYGRTVPLPIPTKRQSPQFKHKPVSSTTGTGTTANSTTTTNPSNSNIGTTKNIPNNLNLPILNQHQSTTTTTATPTTSTSNNHSTSSSSSSTFKPSQHHHHNSSSFLSRTETLSSVTLSNPSLLPAPAPTPSLIAATKKRSQFGFGGNHIVPSVPLPPTLKSMKQINANAIMHNQHQVNLRNTKLKVIPKLTVATANANATASKVIPKPITTIVPITAVSQAKRKKMHHTSPSSSSSIVKATSTTIDTTIPISMPIPQATNMMGIPNEGASYERKKQRAKDARVKLNESIERLSVAINLAGNQSKQRAQAHAYWANKESTFDNNNNNSSSSSSSSSSALSTSNNNTKGPISPSVQTGIKGTVTIMEEAGKTADQAKKWERPSFVGSAATIIQNLNAQCEALMRELIDLKKLQNDGAMQSCQSCRKDRNAGVGVVSDFSHDEIDHGGSNDVPMRKSKKPKLCHEEYKVNINAIIKRDKMIGIIGSFLDPQSILQFMCVLKSWKVQLDPTMKSDLIWSPLCVKRFGAYSVREWLNKDDENNFFLNGDDANSTRTSHMDLYRQMSVANVKPKCHYEGNINLGGGKINNVACAWITAVERSNGETLRSVLTSTDGEIKYASVPVVELRILIQNVGIADTAILIPEQIISIDASTKRRGEEMFEITSDERMSKKVYRFDGSIVSSTPTPNRMNHTIGNLFKLNLFESAILSIFIHAKSCATTTKFRQRANFAKILLNVRGTTLPLVIPISD